MQEIFARARATIGCLAYKVILHTSINDALEVEILAAGSKKLNC